MDSYESKKLALIREGQILKEYSDERHPLTQEDIANYLKQDYGIVMERKAISRNLSLLKEAGMEIESGRSGSYLVSREFEDSELHMLIDSVLCSKHITANYSKDLIKKLCALSNKYFKVGIKNVYSVEEWNKTENPNLFFNIEMIDDAIENRRQLRYDYNKYGIDKKLHKSSNHTVSPYRMLLHNQRYYLMAYSEQWERMVFHRLDRITNMEQVDQPAKKLQNIPGYEKGIDYRDLASARPYLYGDKAERIGLVADGKIVGYYSLFLQENQECELSNLCVSPDYRHRGIGEALLKHAFDKAQELGCRKVNIGIVEENVVLRKWYEEQGCVHLGTKKFEHFPFTCGFMKKEL